MKKKGRMGAKFATCQSGVRQGSGVKPVRKEIFGLGPGYTEKTFGPSVYKIILKKIGGNRVTEVPRLRGHWVKRGRSYVYDMRKK